MIRIPFLRPKRQPIAALYGDIVAVSRAPVAYREFGVADDFEGRFERLVLIATLVLKRLGELPAPAGAMAQELVDQLFADLDDGLRRSGVSDLSVGKKMKKLAQGFYGRAGAYTEALAAGHAALRVALARNLFAGRIAPEAVPGGLIFEIDALQAQLSGASLDDLLAGGAFDTHNAAKAASSAAPP